MVFLDVLCTPWLTVVNEQVACNVCVCFVEGMVFLQS